MTEKLYGQQEQEDLEESMREAFRQRDERLKKAHKRSSTNAQALKPSAKGSSLKPKSTSSKIPDPGYKR